jgi:lipopolysaccharide transport system permease protein
MSHSSTIHQRFALLRQLTLRYILERYRGSALGVLWSLLTPLTLLAVYTFVFTTVFKARWGSGEHEGIGTYATILFAGLILHGFFMECLIRASNLIQSHTNFVKKVIFPLEILVPAMTASALFQLGIGFVILLGATLFLEGNLPVTVLLLPFILLPFVLFTLGLSWILAAMGVFFRDITQIIGLMGTILLFLSTIVIHPDALPAGLQPFIYLNPLSFPVDAVRDVALWGKLPNPLLFIGYSVVSVAMCVFGYAFFAKVRKGFADVL